MEEAGASKLLELEDNTYKSDIQNQEESSKNKIKVLLDTPEEHYLHTSLEDSFNESIIGQEKAKQIIIDTLLSKLLSFREKNGPIGCLFFSGPTGVGKTQIVKALAKILLGNENNFTKINCENYQESFSSRTLFGSPKSYVGYGDESPLQNTRRHYDSAKRLSQLNNIIRELNGFNIILFDEIEKAHPDVRQNLLSLMDEGRIEFTNGKIERYDNSLIIFTSNIGQKEIAKLNTNNPIGFVHTDNEEIENTKIIEKSIKKEFSPEFIGRISKTIEFEYLSKEECKDIIYLQLENLNTSLNKYYPHSKISLFLDDSCIDYILEKGYSKEKGARELLRTFEKYFENKLNILLHSESFEKYFYINTPIELIIEVISEKVQFSISYSEGNNKKRKKEIKKENIETEQNKEYKLSIPLVNEVYSIISQYVELYHINMDGDIDFREDISELEVILKGYGFSHKDFKMIRKRAYTEAISDLNFITDFDGLNIFTNETKDIFHPYKPRIILKVITNQVNKYNNQINSPSFGELILEKVIPIIEKILKSEELSPEQMKEIIIYIKREVINNTD